MSSWKSFVALSALGLLGTGVNSSPCKPSISGTVTTQTSSISVASSTQQSASEAETSITPFTTTAVTSQDSVSTTIFVDESSTTDADSTTTEVLTAVTTAEPSTTTSICQISNPTNYIRNPSFEDPTPFDEDHASPWNPWYTIFKHKSDGWPARTGDYMATVDLSNPLFDDRGEISQQVTGLTVGSWYRISVYWTATYVENPSWDKRCMIVVTAGNSEATYDDSYVRYTTPGQFSQKSFEFKAQSSETEVKFYIGCDYAIINVDHFILDDFEMVEICPPAGQD